MPTTDPTAVSAADQAVIDGFAAAFNAREIEALSSHFAPAARIENPWSWQTDSDGFLEELPWRWAMNEQWEVQSCTHTGGISCVVSQSSDAFDYVFGPMRATMNFRIQSNLIVELVEYDDDGTTGATMGRFYAWVEEEHGLETANQMRIRGGPHTGPPLLSDESIAIWLDLLPEYKAEKGYTD